MKPRTLFCATLACAVALTATQCATRSVSNGSSSLEIPHLRKQGTATQLIVDGKPFLVLSGELANNSATSIEYMKPVWPKLVEAKTQYRPGGRCLARSNRRKGSSISACWTASSGMRGAHNLRVVPLWFASWKNGLSSYPPDWVKKDFDRFPRAQIAGGESIEMLSTLSDANRDADARAFAALMRHIKEVDGQQHTVIMIQLQNEVGMARDSRDRSPAADKAFAGPVPKELMDYLQAHKDALIPEFRQVWQAAGFKTSGTWEEVFGKGAAADEIFMAWNYARYIGRVAAGGQSRIPGADVRERGAVQNSSIADAIGKKPEPGRGSPSAAPWPTCWTSGEPGRRQSTCSRPTLTATGTSRRFAPSTPNPGTRCSYRRTWVERTARPGCSTSSDATMRSAGR